ncbi:MAG: alpha/beta hydrolase [Pseudomonadota bacterium]|nr:alpha/beta hydrolase [Pseudomonadota bacterium]
MLNIEDDSYLDEKGLPPDYWCETGGLRLRAKIWNEQRQGLPIVFLNGVGTSLEIAAPLARQFNGRRFIAIEMPGSGLTPNTSMPLPPPLLARFAVEAARQLGAARFDLIGLSIGGAISQQIAWQYKDKVARLVLAGTCSGMTMLPHDWVEDGLFWTMNPFAVVLSDLMGDLSGPHLQDLIQPTPAAIASQFASFAGWSSLALLPMIRTPSLVLAGARDRIIPPSNAAQLSAFLPNADHRILPDAAHLFPFTEPERTAKHIMRFFEKTPPVPA